MPITLRLRPRDDTLTTAGSWDRLMRRMGWLIPKSEVDLPDPAEWPAVGIVIPVYNAPELLERCLTTLAATNYPADKLRVEIIDNASRDRRTLKLLEAEANVVRFDEPVGFSEAVNAGLKRLGGHKYHILYNQDIEVIDPAWLKHLVRWMEHRPDCGLCGPKLLYENGTIENAGIDMGVGDGCAERGRRQKADDPRFNAYRKTATVSGAVYCLRASVEDRLGLMDERYLFGCEDLEYGMRVAAQIGMEVWYVPDSVLVHSSHAVQRSCPGDKHRITTMHAVSSAIYNSEWSEYYNHLGRRSRVAFILPNFHSACGGARVVAALARYLTNCGVRAEVYVRHGWTKADDPDTDFPQFPIRPLAELATADIVIATRCDTLADAAKVKAEKRYYFVQQIEDVFAGDWAKCAMASYHDKRFEIITIAPHLKDRLAEMGRECEVVDVGFYRDLYPYVERKPKRAMRVLMYGADGHKGPENPAIAKRLTEAGLTVNTVHRYCPWPEWAKMHYRPQTTGEMAAVYADHDIYVYASESDGFAMTPIEAMACGTPVVLSEFPGCEQYARGGENCVMAKYRDAADVAAKAVALAADTKLQARVIKGGLETAARYDWSEVGRQYARMLLGAHV